MSLGSEKDLGFENLATVSRCGNTESWRELSPACDKRRYHTVRGWEGDSSVV